MNKLFGITNIAVKFFYHQDETNAFLREYDGNIIDIQLSNGGVMVVYRYCERGRILICLDDGGGDGVNERKKEGDGKADNSEHYRRHNITFFHITCPPFRKVF